MDKRNPIISRAFIWPPELKAWNVNHDELFLFLETANEALICLKKSD